MSSGGGRSDADIAEAIIAISEVMINPRDHPPQRGRPCSDDP